MEMLGYLIGSLDNEDLLVQVLFAAIASAVIGHILDRVMGRATFGAFGNGMLVFVGIAIAISYGPQNFSLMSSQDTMRMTMLAMGVGTGLLMTLGGLKAYLLNTH